MRGAGWEDTHWGQLFGMLGMKTTGPAAVSKETVTLTHFLEKADLVGGSGVCVCVGGFGGGGWAGGMVVEAGAEKGGGR